MRARAILLLSIIGAVMGVALVARYGGISSSPSIPPAPAVVATAPQLNLEAGHWSISGGYASYEGLVKNISPETLTNLMAVVSFEDGHGRSIVTAEAPINYGSSRHTLQNRT